MQNKNAVIYCRVSTKEQVLEGNSLSSQERICREYAERNNYTVITTFLEKGESAKTDDRTVLTELMSYCSKKEHAVQVVIFYKIDRWARYLLDYGNLKLKLHKLGIIVQSATEYLVDTPAGRFMENVLASQAQFDNEVRAERCAGGMKDAMREGRYVWMATIGYDNVKVGNKSTIAPSSMAILVQKAFEEVAINAEPVEEVRKRMSKSGLLTKNGKPISKPHFYEMLRNPIYCGWIIKFGEKHRGLFEPIITDTLFEQVQRVLRQRKHRTLQYVRDNPDFPLRRFISHPDGRKLTGCWAQGRYKKYAYYRYLNPNKDFRKEQLEQSFVSFLDCFELDAKHYALFREKIKQQFLLATKDERKASEQLAKQIDALKDKQTALIEKNIQGIINDEVLSHQLQLVDKALLEAYAMRKTKPVIHADMEQAINTIADFILKPGYTWQNAPLESKLKLQWFNFPEGVLFDGTSFRTTKTSCVLKLKDAFSDIQSGLVDYSAQFSNIIMQKPNMQTEKDNYKHVESDLNYWNKMATEIVRLADILNERNNPADKTATSLFPNASVSQ